MTTTLLCALCFLGGGLVGAALLACCAVARCTDCDRRATAGARPGPGGDA